MTKQPTLTGFPRTVFATAKRRLQATVRQAREQAIRQSLCGYSLVFARFLPAAFLESNDPTRRQRHFGHIPVFWAWLAQILEANASCSKALGLIQAWYRSSDLPVPRGDTSGYCSARLRLDEGFLKSLLTHVTQSLDRSVRPMDLWHGHVLKAIDGSSVQLMDTTQNQLVYPQSPNQKPGCGFPIMGIVGVLNLSHGGWEGFETCNQRDHDSRIAPRLLNHLHAGDVLLADRAFCSYELFARLVGKGAHGVMRLHQARHAKLDWRRGKKLGPNERLITWNKPAQQPPGSDLSAEQWEELPDQLSLRYVKTHYEDRAGQKRTLVIATTLLDTAKYPAAELTAVYAQRWEIELKLRDIKTTLGMERFAVKTPAMARKTLWMMMISYNLMRGLVQASAIEVGKPLAHMSFKGILDHVTASHDSFVAHRGKPRRQAGHHRSLIETCATKLLVIRPFRREPRAAKRRPKNYPLLTSPRAEYVEIPHRSKPRNVA